jgi:hypothetical protein
VRILTLLDPNPHFVKKLLITKLPFDAGDSTTAVETEFTSMPPTFVIEVSASVVDITVFFVRAFSLI